MSYEVKTSWKGKMAFDSKIDEHTVRTDAKPPLGESSGSSPKKLLLASLAGCTGIDVISLLEKMRVPITNLEIDTEADLTEDHPKIFSEVRITYRVFGKGINRKKVEKAIKLSKDKYCGVSAILGASSPIKYVIEYVEE